MKTAFVILCYGNAPLAIECVDYLNKIKRIEAASIVLVDNNSPDGTGEKLQENFKENGNVYVLRNKENAGFAKGNNFGYRYAKEILGCDIQVIMNDDVFIYDSNFIVKLENIISEEPDIAILAPDALGDQNRHTNPLYNGVVSKKHVWKNILMNILSNFLLSLHLDYKRQKNLVSNKNEKQEIQYGIMPHGCCVIFAPRWVEKEDKAFYPKTFLFCEEYFITAYALEKGYKIQYNPNLVVKHIGDASLDASSTNSRKKRFFVNKNQTKSLKIYLDFIKDINQKWSEGRDK